MTIRTANNTTPGVHVYYVRSESGADYIVTHVRRAGMDRWSCTCPDFTFRRQAKGSHRFCKHVKEVVASFATRTRAA